ncbi:hypothetical protein JCM3774_000366 [Rhodotorula dairenensis]
MENPWGEPSPPLAPSSALDSTADTAHRTHQVGDGQDDDAGRVTAPRLSLELAVDDDDDDAPAWDAQDSPDGVDDADAWESEARASRLAKGSDVLSSQQLDDQPSHDSDFQAPASEPQSVDEPTPAIAPPIPVVPAADITLDVNAGQQMDDFPEYDEPPNPSSDAFDTRGGEGGDDDDFDDFGDATTARAGAGEDNDGDEFGDFGDFGDAAPLDEAAFEAAPAAEQPPFPSSSFSSTSPSFSHQPFASTSTATSYPPLRFDVTDPSRQAISSQLHEFWDAAFPAATRAVTDEPERQVEGVAQVLVTESSRSLWSELSTLPPLRPVDWRRSRIRREHLISMGFPVSQEEETPLPSMTAQTSPNPAFSVPARPSSAPPPASSSSAAALSSSQNGLGRPSTPLGTTAALSARGNHPNGRLQRSLGPGGLAPAPPPFDHARADQVLAISEGDLALRSLAELRELDAELDRISVDASGLLTHALMLREKESQDKDVYNGMIQDLVIAAAKMKTSSAVSAGAGKEPKRSGSGRWKLSK